MGARFKSNILSRRFSILWDSFHRSWVWWGGGVTYLVSWGDGRGDLSDKGLSNQMGLDLHAPPLKSPPFQYMSFQPRTADLIVSDFFISRLSLFLLFFRITSKTQDTRG